MRDCAVAGLPLGRHADPDSPITWEDVTNATAITYPNCYRNQMTGAQLKEVLEDVADNIFHPDPYFQGGGDMVRIGGMGYSIDVSKPMGSRISDLTHLKSGKPIDAAKSYSVAGWASVNEGTQGRRSGMWSAHISKRGTVKVEPNTAVKVSGA
jgi:sulfur-oxidizing protein SoxB